MASDNSGGEQEAKRLRSSEPDLKVVLGSGGDEETQWCHSQTLAAKSKYIDAMLAAPMRERDERTITFPDISLDAWTKMLSFLDDPLATRRMKASDALEVAVHYDKYEFEEGRKLCDAVIADYFSEPSIKDMESKFTIDLDSVIDLVLVSHEANLDSAFKAGISYIWLKMRNRDGPYQHTRYGKDIPYGRMMFTADHLKKLQPLLKYSSDNRAQLGLDAECTSRYLVTGGFSGGDTVPLDHPKFPEEFVAKCESTDEWSLLRACISHIELSGAGGADGAYEKEMGCWDIYRPPGFEERTDRWGGQMVTFRIEFWKDDDFEGWVIVRRLPPTRLDEDGEPDPDSIVKQKCFIAPYSKHRKRPPLRGWVSADPLAYGNPTIKYILNESIG